MGKKAVLGGVIASLVIAYGCSGSSGTTAYSVQDFEFPLESTDVATGSEVFAEFCEGCHPGGEKGDGPKIAGLELSPARTRWQVRAGGKDMPAFGPDKISDAKLEALLAYTTTFGVVAR
ncbi:MAG: cytochrome c [Myxococcales bacterium]|nr:cytochrome c [Myxococcales bacterium]